MDPQSTEGPLGDDAMQDERAAPRAADATPALPVRLLWAFVSPGRLGELLAERPRWAGALLLTAAVMGVSIALVPVEIMTEVQRQAMLERGGDFPEMSERALNVMRIVMPSVTVLSSLIFTFVFAGLYTLVFAFILGDEGRFTQYLAVLAHSSFIAATFALLITPLRISTENPQLTVNLAGLLPFLGDGYLSNVFRALDVSQIWSTLVFARGAHAIDPRRSFGSAAVITLTILLMFALVIARFI